MSTHVLRDNATITVEDRVTKYRHRLVFRFVRCSLRVSLRGLCPTVQNQAGWEPVGGYSATFRVPVWQRTKPEVFPSALYDRTQKTRCRIRYVLVNPSRCTNSTSGLHSVCGMNFYCSSPSLPSLYRPFLPFSPTIQTILAAPVSLAQTVHAVAQVATVVNTA